ncbi:MAG: hypothetical protein HY808_03665 [Nitrospirae bacterium]|nr:hypothetical protein [Nitrospirota bacterium]
MTNHDVGCVEKQPISPKPRVVTIGFAMTNTIMSYFLLLETAAPETMTAILYVGIITTRDMPATGKPVKNAKKSWNRKCMPITAPTNTILPNWKIRHNMRLRNAPNVEQSLF